MVNPLATGPFPSATPPPGGPGMLDRTPSYGLGSPSFPGTPPKKGNAATTMVVGLAIVTLAIVGMVLVKWSRPVGPSAANDTAASATPLTTATSYKLIVAVTPASATLEIDGANAGTGVVSRDMPKDGQPHVLRVSAPGFTETVVPFDEAHPAPPTIVLRPAAPGTASAQPVVKPVNAGGGAHPVQTAKTPDNRSKTDNINPWE